MKIKDEILKVLVDHESEVDNWNKAVFPDKYSQVADAIVKLTKLIKPSIN